MTKSLKSTHTHPRPLLDRLIQYGAAAVIGVMLISAPLQIVLSLGGAPGGLFILTAVATLLLIPPVMLLTASTPAVSVDADGITLQPVIWRSRFVEWKAVESLKDYPLLPPSDTEIGRKALVGRQRYQPAAGKMLVIPGLPPQYRVAGFLAGEGLKPVIAITNRTHTDYDKLVKKVMIYFVESRV